VAIPDIVAIPVFQATLAIPEFQVIPAIQVNPAIQESVATVAILESPAIVVIQALVFQAIQATLDIQESLAIQVPMLSSRATLVPPATPVIQVEQAPTALRDIQVQALLLSINNLVGNMV